MSSMKKPNFPGAEKFRITSSAESLDITTQPTTVEDTKTRICQSRRRNPRRCPNLPICRLTSRVLNNTNAQLSADYVEAYVRGDVEEVGKLNSHCKNYIIQATDHVRAQSPSNSLDSSVDSSTLDSTIDRSSPDSDQ